MRNLQFRKAFGALLVCIILTMAAHAADNTKAASPRRESAAAATPTMDPYRSAVAPGSEGQMERWITDARVAADRDPNTLHGTPTAAAPMSPMEEWYYWQDHYDELEAMAAEPAVPQPSKGAPGRGISAEVDGCKYKHPMNEFEDAGCLEWFYTGSWHLDCTYTGHNAYLPNPYVENRFFWVQLQSETGEKCEVASPFTSIAAIIGEHTKPSTSMDQWLASAMADPYSVATNEHGYYDFNYGPENYYTSIFGWSFAAGGYTPQTWSATVYGAHTSVTLNHPVKYWWCNTSGIWCETETKVVY